MMSKCDDPDHCSAYLRAEVERLKAALRWIQDAPFNKHHLQDHARRALEKPDA